MKYPKVLQVLMIAAAVTTAVPAVPVPAYAADGRETPAEYEARTEYILPAGYHYVLEDIYVILDANGVPVIEADAAPEVPEVPVVPETPEIPVVSEEPEAADIPEVSATPEASDSPDIGDASEGADTLEVPDISGGADGSGEPGVSDGADNAEEPDMPEIPDTPEVPGGTEGSDDIEGSDGPDNSGDAEVPEVPDNSGDVTVPEVPDNSGDAADTPVEPEVPEPPKTPEVLVNPSPVDSLLTVQEPQMDVTFLTSEQFKAIRDRIQYNVEVPIEGLPSFITQEMIVGALKAQDETGYPASVTIAQIIQESGYGKYGPGGEEGKGLSYLAYQYCNLFGIKGKGTAGSAVMNTFEMTASGETYNTQAGFRAYHTYTECIEDRSKLLKEVYSDLTENVTDANTFAMKIGRRWATDINYGKSLIRTMQRYDLYRLDEMTLVDFSKLIGRFANPCPGSAISSTFGYRTFDHSFHKGLDMGTGTENIPTYAAEAGTVTFAGEAGTAGNLIVIDHGDGLVTKYMHHEEIYVEEGQQVEKGQQIGLSGTTGYSTGNHLHFQVEENGTAVDPLKYLQEESAETVKMRKKVSVDTDKIVKNIKTSIALHKMEEELEDR